MTINSRNSLAALLALVAFAVSPYGMTIPVGGAVSAADEGAATPGSPLAAVRAALESEDFAALSEALESARSARPEDIVEVLQEGLPQHASCHPPADH